MRVPVMRSLDWHAGGHDPEPKAGLLVRMVDWSGAVSLGCEPS